MAQTCFGSSGRFQQFCDGSTSGRICAALRPTWAAGLALNYCALGGGGYGRDASGTQHTPQAPLVSREPGQPSKGWPGVQFSRIWYPRWAGPPKVRRLRPQTFLASTPRCQCGAAVARLRCRTSRSEIEGGGAPVANGATVGFTAPHAVLLSCSAANDRSSGPEQLSSGHRIAFRDNGTGSRANGKTSCTLATCVVRRRRALRLDGSKAFRRAPFGHPSPFQASRLACQVRPTQLHPGARQANAGYRPPGRGLPPRTLRPKRCDRRCNQV